jgi:hypothetical protein
MELIEYTPGYKLKDDELLLKIWKTQTIKDFSKGFITKLNKDGSVPVAFLAWGTPWGKSDADALTTWVFTETYRSGWKILGWRFGKSQNWATMKHPEGFTVEVYMRDLLEVIFQDTIDYGTLSGKYKWENHKLIREK